MNKKLALILGIVLVLLSCAGIYWWLQDRPLEVERSYSIKTSGEGFENIPLLEKATSTFSNPSYSDIRSSCSFAVADDFYALSSTSWKHGRFNFIEPDWGKTVFYDREGVPLGESDIHGVLFGISDKILLTTRISEYSHDDINIFLIGRIEGKFLTQKIKFRKEDSFKYVTGAIDGSVIFVFDEYLVIADSVDIGTDGCAVLSGKRVNYASCQDMCFGTITKFGFSHIDHGKRQLLAYKWGEKPEDKPVKLLETPIPLDIIRDAREHLSVAETYYKAGLFSACVLQDSVMLTYSKDSATVLLVNQDNKWNYVTILGDIPERFQAGVTESIHSQINVNPDTSDFFISLEHKLVVISGDLHSSQSYPQMNRNVKYSSSIQMVDGKLVFLTPHSNICRIDSEGYSISDFNLNLSLLPQTIPFDSGFLQTASNWERSKITLLKYPEFQAESLWVEGNITAVSNVVNDEALICVARNDETFLIRYDTKLLEIISERKINLTGLVTQIFLSKSSNQFGLVCDVELSDAGLKRQIIMGNGNELVVFHKISPDEFREFRIIDIFDDKIYLEGISPFELLSKHDGILLLEKDNEPKNLYSTSTRKRNWNKAPYHFTYGNHAYRYEFNEEGNVKSFLFLDDRGMSYPLFNRFVVNKQNSTLQFSTMFMNISTGDKRHCLLIDEDGKRHLWELDRFVGYVYAPNTNPDKLYSPSIVPGKIIEFTRDK